MIKNQIVELQDLLAKSFENKPNDWKDEIIDPEGDLSQKATPFTRRVARNTNCRRGLIND